MIFVALEMLDSGQYELGHLATSVQDVIRRGRVTRETALQLTAEASEAASPARSPGARDLPPFEQIAEAFRERVRELGTPRDRSSPRRAARLRPPRRRGARAPADRDAKTVSHER